MVDPGVRGGPGREQGVSRTVQMRTLGGTGIKVSSYCLGAMMFGQWGNPAHDECERMIHTALDAGINFIDTAGTYSEGESEQIVGKAIKGRRDEVVLATKVGGPAGADVNMRGSSRRWLVRAIEDSLRRLSTDHIDLYQVHRPDPHTDLDETLGALSDLVRAGKVRTIGTSTFPAEQLVEAQWIAQQRGHVRFRVEQAPYSLLTRGVESAVLPTCARYGTAVIVWSPLRGGVLSGRYRNGATNTGSPRKVMRRLFDPQVPGTADRFEVTEKLATLAGEFSVSLAHMAIAFVLSHPAITSAIVGPRTPEQLDDLLAGTEVRLSDELLDRIDEIVMPGTNVPSWEVFGNNPALLDLHTRRRTWDERGAEEDGRTAEQESARLMKAISKRSTQR